MNSLLKLKNNVCAMLILLILSNCTQRQNNQQELIPEQEIQFKKSKVYTKNAKGQTISTRFPTPSGYFRNEEANNSFGKFLRNLPLKKDGAEVILYNGQVKTNNNIYESVIDLPIGTKNLHQCADAIIRLRAEYLWENTRYEEIKFNLTNGFEFAYINWAKGERLKIAGNKTWMSLEKDPSYSYKDFWDYLENTFMYAGTISLEKELKSKALSDIEIGDVFIKGGSPGHAIIIVDMATNISSGEKLIILAQSYMPAQEIQILSNPANINSPWYSANFTGLLKTPEWSFEKSELKGFE